GQPGRRQRGDGHRCGPWLALSPPQWHGHRQRRHRLELDHNPDSRRAQHALSYNAAWMTREEALVRVKHILERDFEIPAHKVTMDASLMGTLGMDSLDVVDFVSYLEYAFNIDVGLQAYRDLDTVQKLLDFVLQQSNQAAAP